MTHFEPLALGTPTMSVEAACAQVDGWGPEQQFGLHQIARVLRKALADERASHDRRRRRDQERGMEMTEPTEDLPEPSEQDDAMAAEYCHEFPGNPSLRALDELAIMFAIARKEGQREATQWRPIETAPRDGTVVLVYRPNGKINSTYSGRIGADAFGTVASYKDEWAHSTVHAQPTHWMPLPEPPLAEGIDPRDPNYSRPGIFATHNCWKCKDGADLSKCPTPDRPGNCGYPHARND